MAPNRKAHTEISEGITSMSKFVVTSKFPTMTEQSEAGYVVVEPNVDASNAPSSGSTVSYWDWPTDPALEAIQQGEKIQALFSADHIAANLVAASSCIQHLQQVNFAPLKSVDDVDFDNYWFTPGSNVEPDIVRNDLTSALHIESNLVKGSNAKVEKTTPVLIEENQSYWEWPAWKAKEKSLQLLRRQEEACRLLSVNHIETTTTTTALPIATNDDYWAF
jgi:hypothetical protein